LDSRVLEDDAKKAFKNSIVPKDFQDNPLPLGGRMVVIDDITSKQEQKERGKHGQKTEPRPKCGVLFFVTVHRFWVQRSGLRA